MKNWTNYLFVVTLTFFTLGFFNIIFAWLGFACMLLPFVFVAKDKKKTWCQGYCPRANLFTKLFKGRSLIGKVGPDWLVKGAGKWIVLGYFTINLFILTMSTIMVSKGRIDAVEQVRFMIAFPLPFTMPQLLDFGPVSAWATHLSFRIYSMMFTTTVLGLILGLLFMPRTWCTVCPINTLSDMALKNTKNSNPSKTNINEPVKA